MIRVFLSYAREDVDAARTLADEITRAGHDGWWDRFKSMLATAKERLGMNEAVSNV